MNKIFFFFLALPQLHAAEPTAPKWRAPKEMNFDQMLIEGSLKRPELAVVTGDSPENDGGLLRLRENFKDRAADFAGQVLK